MLMLAWYCLLHLMMLMIYLHLSALVLTCTDLTFDLLLLNKNGLNLVLNSVVLWTWSQSLGCKSVAHTHIDFDTMMPVWSRRVKTLLLLRLLLRIMHADVFNDDLLVFLKSCDDLRVSCKSLTVNYLLASFFIELDLTQFEIYDVLRRIWVDQSRLQQVLLRFGHLTNRLWVTHANLLVLPLSLEYSISDGLVELIIIKVVRWTWLMTLGCMHLLTHFVRLSPLVNVLLVYFNHVWPPFLSKLLFWARLIGGVLLKLVIREETRHWLLFYDLLLLVNILYRFVYFHSIWDLRHSYLRVASWHWHHWRWRHRVIVFD